MVPACQPASRPSISSYLKLWMTSHTFLSEGKSIPKIHLNPFFLQEKLFCYQKNVDIYVVEPIAYFNVILWSFFLVVCVTHYVVCVSVSFWQKMVRFTTLMGQFLQFVGNFFAIFFVGKQLVGNAKDEIHTLLLLPCLCSLLWSVR